MKRFLFVCLLLAVPLVPAAQQQAPPNAPARDPGLSAPPGRRGTASAGPNTGRSHFFITHAATPHLNGKHTVFGQVVEGQDVVVAIGNVSRDAEGKPRRPVLLQKVVIERAGP